MTTPSQLCLRAARELIKIAGLWQTRYGLQYVPVTAMTVIYTAGTTWLIAASETAHKKETKLRFLEQAETCAEYLKETGTYWETGTHLERLLNRVISLQRAKLEGTLPPKYSTTPDHLPPTSRTTHTPNEFDSDHVNTTVNTPQETLTVENNNISCSTPPELNLQEYFGQEMEIRDSYSGNSLFMDDEGDFMKIFGFEANIPDFFGSFDPSSTAPADYQDQTSDPPTADQLFIPDPVSNSIDISTNMDWTSMFGITLPVSPDVDMMGFISHSELGMPAGDEFPLVPSSHIPGIFSQQQNEAGWNPY